jgi:hypothetical protein
MAGDEGIALQTAGLCSGAWLLSVHVIADAALSNLPPSAWRPGWLFGVGECRSVTALWSASYARVRPKLCENAARADNDPTSTSQIALYSTIVVSGEVTSDQTPVQICLKLGPTSVSSGHSKLDGSYGDR